MLACQHIMDTLQRPMIGRHLVPVQLSLRAFLTHPMHTLMAAKCGAVRVNAICSIALIVPLKQQRMFCCCKR